MALRIEPSTREVQDPSYDGRNGFPTYEVREFLVIEEEMALDQKITRTMCRCTDEAQADRVIKALRETS